MTAREDFGCVVVDPDGSTPAAVPLMDRIFVGRECSGVDESRRVILEGDLAVSRNHLEIRVDRESWRAVLVDTSSNGTRLNGVRIERSVGVPLSSGDRIQVGRYVLEFRGRRVTRPVAGPLPRATITANTSTDAAVVVGDIVNYSTVSEQVDQELLARDVGCLFDHLRSVLSDHSGTLMNYVGDAFFASWEMEADPRAVDNALSFAIAGSRRVSEYSERLELRYSDGSPLKMGWAVAFGRIVIRLMPGNLVTALGDTVNVGFRIAGISGRDGRGEILATRAVRELAQAAYSFGRPQAISVKGRMNEETVYEVSLVGSAGEVTGGRYGSRAVDMAEIPR
jgi:adenylate cyclase